MAFTTGAMMFDFAFFREQTCIVACPYGRFQSVMLDRDSLIVSYDTSRGEPRGKGLREKPDGTKLGDCIDCGACVDTCPTGIDIRNGLQLECVACTQCIDACDSVMERMKWPLGLIRFSSQSRMANENSRVIRPRVILYPAILLVLLSAFTIVLAGKESSDITLLRGFGLPYTEIKEGEITNQVRVKIKNRNQADAEYAIELAGEHSATMQATTNPVPVAAGQSQTVVVLITAPEEEFRGGKYDVTLQISDGQEFSKQLSWQLLGPRR
jgi:cytochrome c oxidase accessory protein FixG